MKILRFEFAKWSRRFLEKLKAQQARIEAEPELLERIA